MADELIKEVIRTVPSDRLWFDPMALTVNSRILMHDVTIGVSTNDLIAQPNSSRFMLGIMTVPSGLTYTCAPWPDVDKFVWDSASLTVQFKFYKLFDIGPIVCNGWYARSAFGGTLRIIEVIRN